jgi:hypothetical protein
MKPSSSSMAAYYLGRVVAGNGLMLDILLPADTYRDPLAQRFDTWVQLVA